MKLKLTERVKEAVSSVSAGSTAEPSRFVLNCEQIGAAMLFAALIGLVGRFLPFWAEGAVLLVSGVAAWWCLDYKYRVGALSLVAMSAFYFLLGQPILALGAVAAGSLGAAGYAGWRVEGGAMKRVSVAIATAVGSAAVMLGIYAGFYLYVLPAIHPVTVWFFNISPAVSVVSTLAILAYVSVRQPVGKTSLYWLATPVLALLFCLFFWPSKSYIAMGVVVIAAVLLSWQAFQHRPTYEKTERSHTPLMTASALGLAFCAWFWLANSWTWLYHYQMANAISVTQIEKLPATTNTRLVPLIAAQDFCAQGNDQSFTDVGTEAHPIVIKKDGEEKMYWQCLRHPTRFAGHSLLYLTGGIEGVVLADAGSKGRFGSPLDVNFIFGESSLFTKGAFYARHPGSQMQSGLVGRREDGTYALLIPYTSKVPQWGGMVPDLSGVMVISQWGFIQDYTPDAARKAFPGVALYPSSLARQYAELWAAESSLYAKHWSGNLLKVSEASQDGDNLYPFWQSFETGMYGVIPFEPVGQNQTALKAVGLIDPVDGSMKIFRTESVKVRDVTGQNQTGDLPGPKQIVANVALSHPGLNGVKTVEALLVVSPDGHIYWVTALLQSNTKTNHGYSMNVLYDGHASGFWDVDSTAKVNSIVKERDEKAAKAAAPANNAGAQAPAQVPANAGSGQAPAQAPAQIPAQVPAN